MCQHCAPEAVAQFWIRRLGLGEKRSFLPCGVTMSSYNWERAPRRWKIPAIAIVVTIVGFAWAAQVFL